MSYDQVLDRYLETLLASLKMVLRINEADLLLSPENEHEKGMIGFNVHSNADAMGLEGKIEIRARFVIPEGTKITFDVQDTTLNELIQKLEFIKCKEPFYMNETIESLGRKKNKSSKK